VTTTGSPMASPRNPPGLHLAYTARMKNLNRNTVTTVAAIPAETLRDRQIRRTVVGGTTVFHGN